MMNNLFSIFDSSTSQFLSLNWFTPLMNLILIPMNFWMFYSKLMYIYMLLMNVIMMELKIIMNNKFNMMNSIFLISLMISILINNLMSLMPYIFTSSGHLVYSISISLPMWLGIIMFLYTMNMNFMFSHMIPQGTPNLLMPFMTLIETISNIIRPWTLAIRLTANMIAGHLLLTLLSQNCLNFNTLIIVLILFVQIILLILEFSVSIIQSYVFTILSTLYIKETNYGMNKNPML